MFIQIDIDKDAILRGIGVLDEAELAEIFRQSREDRLYFDSIAPELVKDFPDHWVAVHRKKVIGKGKDQEELVGELKDGGLWKIGVVLEFLPSKPVTRITRIR